MNEAREGLIERILEVIVHDDESCLEFDFLCAAESVLVEIERERTAAGYHLCREGEAVIGGEVAVAVTRGAAVWMPCCRECMNGPLSGREIETGLCADCAPAPSEPAGDPEAAQAQPKVVDLMAALEESIAAAKEARKRHSRPSTATEVEP